nr:uncharacterized protein LOC127328924 [Lolium perenne]
MDSSSSSSSGLSYRSSSSREPTPEDIRAPERWDEADWDFSVWSEDDESLTYGEDNLHFLVDGDSEEEDDDDALWGEDISSDEEDEEVEEDTSSDEYPPMKRFRTGSDDDDDDDDEEEYGAPAEGFGSIDEEPAGSSTDSSHDNTDEGSNGP